MTPSSATPCRTSRATRRRRRNAAAGGAAAATARALGAGLWRQRHGSSSKKMLGANQRRAQCPCSRNHHEGIRCSSSIMEKATKWDHLEHDDILLDPSATTHWKMHHHHHLPRSRSSVVAFVESELARARAQIVELEEEKRVTNKRLERFLRKLEEEKAAWKSRMKEDLRLERKHRRELEVANAKLLRELSEARQLTQSYEMERKARELMEEACSELTREVEEGQAEVELLRRECLRMRDEMEEERRMLQMAEVWREERVQMKLSDAKLALERKYSQLNRLQAEMESSALRVNGDAAASSSLRSRSRRDDDDKVDADSVFEHFRRKEEKQEKEEESPASSSNNLESVSPATDLFLAKVDNGNPFSDDGSADDGDRDSCSWAGISDHPSVSVPVVAAAGNESFSVSHSNGATRRSGATKNTALIRRLWSTAINESRKKTGPAPRSGGAQANGGGWSPPSDRNRKAAAAEAPQCSSSNRRHQQREQRRGTQHYNQKQSLKEKLMEARIDDHKEKPPSDKKQ